MIGVPNALIYRDTLVGGQPSEEGYEALASAGYLTVIDVRVGDEEGAAENQQRAQAAGLHYTHLPIAGAADLTRANVERFAQAIAACQRPLVVHCKSGNRIGALFALKAFWLDDLSAAASLEEGRAAGLTSLESRVIAMLGLDA